MRLLIASSLLKSDINVPTNRLLSPSGAPSIIKSPLELQLFFIISMISLRYDNPLSDSRLKKGPQLITSLIVLVLNSSLVVTGT